MDKQLQKKKLNISSNEMFKNKQIPYTKVIQEKQSKGEIIIRMAWQKKGKIIPLCFKRKVRFLFVFF